MEHTPVGEGQGKLLTSEKLVAHFTIEASQEGPSEDHATTSCPNRPHESF